MRKHPRILHLQTGSGLYGGISGYISSLVLSSAMREWPNVVVASGATDDPDRAAVLYGTARKVVLPQTYGPFSFIKYRQALRRVIRNEGIDLVHAHALRSALPAAIVCKSFGLPLLYTNHGLRYTQKTSRMERAVFKTIETYICHRSSGVVAIRKHDAGILCKDRLTRDNRLHTIETRITPRSSHAKAHSSAPALLIGVGSLINVKRPDRFIEWVAAVEKTGIPTDAVWAGEGPLRPSLEAEVTRRNLPVRFPGHLEPEALARLYAEASLLLLSSEFEVFPLSVLEAAANGVPVVSGRFDGIEDIVEPQQTGLLVDADDAAGTASAIAGLLADRPRLERMSQAAREGFIRRFADSDLMASEYVKLYRSLLVFEPDSNPG
jgi:glycosyltransferase involved in cell wall biosynthesis